jgi:hypothetical protein
MALGMLYSLLKASIAPPLWPEQVAIHARESVHPLESEARAEGETGVDDEAWMSERDPEFRAIATKGNSPAFARVLSSLGKGFDLDLDEVTGST